MKITVKLEKTEEEALKTISMASCTDVGCSVCPFHYQDDDLDICIKGLCGRLLEDYLNQN